MREYVTALRAVWDCWQRGTPVDLPGPHYPIQRMQPFFRPEPLEDPAIPIHLAAIGPRMTQLAGECADVLVTHPTNTSPRFLRERMLPDLAIGAGRSARERTGAALLVGGFVATGPGSAEVAAERARIREYLGFLYSTPAYAPTLELLGMGDLGERLRGLARERRWGEMAGQVPEELVDAIVPCAPYAEIAEVLREWYGELALGQSFPVPTDPAHDDAARKAISALGAA
jgi:probable F420-dependent oxidoreductase